MRSRPDAPYFLVFSGREPTEINRICAVAVLVGAAMLSLTACGEKPCDRARMVTVASKDIVQSGRNADEYRVGPVKPVGTRTHIEVEQKMYPGYYRHYTFDNASCRIVNLAIDQ
jgi:hypothetical protein